MTRHHPLRNFHVRFLCLAFAWSNFFGFGVAPADAQDNDNSPASGQVSGFASVAMAWSDARPLFYIDDKGAVTGLGSELAYAIGRELGFEIKPYRVPDFATWGHDQNSGVSEILPMAAKLPRLAENNFFSDVVFTSEVRFAVRVEDSDTFDYKEISGKRIGVLTPGAGSDPALYPGASILSFPNTRAALIALLSREIDAIATESGLTFAEAQAARLDQRIAFVGPPLEVLERVVIVHKTRVELLDPINDAIAKMKADGRIDDLVKRFRSRVPSVAPKVLKVPVAHLAPWMIVEDDSVRGFSVELVAEIANRSGLSIEFIPVSLKEYFEALDSANADLFPVVRKADKIGEVLDLTIPIQILPLEIVVRDTDTQLQTLADLSAIVSECLACFIDCLLSPTTTVPDWDWQSAGVLCQTMVARSAQNLPLIMGQDLKLPLEKNCMPKPIKLAMLIDDSEIDQRLYKRVLEKSGLVEAISCFTYADQALDHLLENPQLEVSVIFLDINMPRMNGFEFLEAASESLSRNYAKAVVVMLTTSLNPDDEDRARSFEVVKEFITKPLIIENIQTVADLLGD